MRAIKLFAPVLLVASAASLAVAQSEPPKPDTTKVAKGVVGQWRGWISVQGSDMEMTASIGKQDSTYYGTMASSQGEMQLTQIKVEGDKVTALGVAQTPNGNFEVWYTFTLKDDTLSGQAEASFNGQSFAMPMTLKRVTGP